MAFSKGHALIIGIGTYKYAPQLDVPITTYDAKEVAEVLRDESYCGYPPDQVTLLHDTDATRDRIMQELDKLAEKLKQDDTLFLFYSGHGMHGYAEDDSYYLTTHDSKVKQEEQFQRVIDNSGISGDELITAINAIKAKRIFQFFNACHSGALILGLLDGSQTHNYQGTEPLPDNLSTLLGSGEGRVTITACREGELSSFSPEDKLTFFGYALTEGLRGNREIPIEDGCITIFNLYSYIHRQVKAAVKRVDKKKNQEPKIFTIMVGDLPIALHSGSRFKDVINDFSNNFKNNVVIYIEKMNLYERIYSLFSRIQFECYNPMVRDLRRIEDKKDTLKSLDVLDAIQSYLDSIRYCYQELQNQQISKDIKVEIEEWLNHINNAIQELDILTTNKDLDTFKIANWHIKQVMNDETAISNQLFLKTIKLILENLHTEELEIVVNEPINLKQGNLEIKTCISNLLGIKKIMYDYIDICSVLEKITKKLIKHRGELKEPILAEIFINGISSDIKLLKDQKLFNQLNELQLVLKDWEIIEASRDTQKIDNLLSNIKKIFTKTNHDLKNQCNELMRNEDKLKILKNQ